MAGGVGQGREILEVAVQKPPLGVGEVGGVHVPVRWWVKSRPVPGSGATGSHTSVPNRSSTESKSKKKVIMCPPAASRSVSAVKNAAALVEMAGRDRGPVLVSKLASSG